MNGDDLFQESAPPATVNGGIFSDFLSAGQAKINEITARFSTLPSSPQDSVGGSIFNAIYQFGAGRLDLARQQAAEALLKSKTGQRFVGEVERQRIQQWLPWIIGAAILLLMLGFFARR